MVVTSYEAPIKVFIFLMIYKQIFTAAFEEISPRFVGRIETEQEKVGDHQSIISHVLAANVHPICLCVTNRLMGLQVGGEEPPCQITMLV